MIPDINLLPKKEKKANRSKIYIILFTIFLAIAIVFMSFQFFLLTKNIRVLEDEKNRHDIEHNELKEQLALLEMPKEFDLELAVEFIESVSYPVTPIIIELNKDLNEHTYLRNYSFSEDRVSFSVDFETMTEVANYIELLMTSPMIDDIIVNNMSTFNPSNYEEDERFEVIDRYANAFEALLNLNYLREIGGESQ